LSLVIGNEWNILFANNPKIHAFAVVKDGKIIWQTDNWNLVEDIKSIMKTVEKESSELSSGGVIYKRIASSKDTYVATADGKKGHFLLVRIEGNIWAIAFAAPSSVPELTMIDIKKTAIKLRGSL